MTSLRRLTASIRFRVTALAALVLVAVLLAASIGLVASQRRLLTQNVDDTVRETADRIQTLVHAGRIPPILTSLGEDDTVGQVVAPSGTVLATSRNARGRPPVGVPPPSGRRETIRTVHGMPSGPSAFRLVSRRVEGPGGPAVIYVAGTLEEVGQSTRAITASLLGALPFALVVLSALIWWLVGRTLRPVEAMRAEVAAISGSDLHRRVPVPPSDDEVALLARTMNDMLGRVDAAAEQQRRFVADASHELRSPLTRMRSALEVDLAHSDSADLAATHESVLDEMVGLQQLVADLLHLARSDAGAVLPKRATAVDLDDIVFSLAGRVRAQGRIRVEVAGVSPVQVTGDAEQLTRAIGNVADNAARYAAQSVTFTLVEREGSAELTVTDDGPGIGAEHHARVFERFTRLDESRSAAGGGAGLGLAIARDIIHRHGGSVIVDPEHRPGARFVITLPLAPS